MTILHTVNKSPFDKNSLESCLKHTTEGSAVLLIEDGVYGALKNTAISSDLKSAMLNVSIYALEADVQARGIDSNLLDGIELIDYKGFVELSIKHDKVQSWL